MNIEKPQERPGAKRPRTDLEDRILELYRQLPDEKRKVMLLSAALSAAAARSELDHEARMTYQRLSEELVRGLLTLLRLVEAAVSAEGKESAG